MHTRKVGVHKRHRTQRGKGRWRSGADTCVMKPVVGCTNNQTPAVVTANPNSYVSRIVPGTSQDAATEAFLRANYRPLIDNNLIVVSITDCTPNFTPQDNISAQDYAPRGDGCTNLQIRQAGILPLPPGITRRNLITPKFGDDLYRNKQAVYGDLSQQEMFRYLKTAIIASAFMVPDNGPWLIHTDLHTGNVLEIKNPVQRTVTIGNVQLTLQPNDPGPDRGNGQYAIADWGRVIRIDNIDDDQAIYTALTTRFPRGVDQYNRPFDKLGAEVWDGLPGRQRFIQHPPILGARLRAYRDNPLANRAAIRPLLRGWTAYVLLYQCIYYWGQSLYYRYPTQGSQQAPSQQTIDRLTAILASTSQADLITRINALARSVPVEAGRDFIRVLPPPAPAACVDSISAVAQGVIDSRGRGTVVFAKEDKSCSVQTERGKFLKLWLPDDAAARARIGRFARVLTPAEMKRRSGVYTWILGSRPNSDVRELVFAKVLSAFEVATAHLTLAANRGFSRIYSAGEAQYDKPTNTLTINTVSGTYMQPLLQANPTPQCQDALATRVGADIATQVNPTGSPPSIIQNAADNTTFIRDDMRPSTEILAKYMSAGVHVEEFDSREACNATTSPDIYRRPGGRTVADAEQQYQGRRPPGGPARLYYDPDDVPSVLAGSQRKIVTGDPSGVGDIYEFTSGDSVYIVLQGEPDDDIATGRLVIGYRTIPKCIVLHKEGTPEGVWTPEQPPAMYNPEEYGFGNI